jgi:hypothetical protein
LTLALSQRARIGGPATRRRSLPRCIVLPELTERIGWEREHGYRWRSTPCDKAGRSVAADDAEGQVALVLTVV